MLKDINDNRRTIIQAAYREVTEAMAKQGIAPDQAAHAALAATAKVSTNMIGHEITVEMVQEVMGVD